MPATLTETQLQAALTAEQITALEDNRPSWNSASPSPVAEEISAAIARVDLYTTGYLPAAALLTGWARDLAAWALCKRLGIQNEGQTAAKDRALLELEAVRDGKFSGLTRAAASSVSFGSKENILP